MFERLYIPSHTLSSFGCGAGDHKFPPEVNGHGPWLTVDHDSECWLYISLRRHWVYFGNEVTHFQGKEISVPLVLTIMIFLPCGC